MEEVFSFLHVSFNAYYFIVTPSIVFGVWVIYWKYNGSLYQQKPGFCVSQASEVFIHS